MKPLKPIELLTLAILYYSGVALFLEKLISKPAQFLIVNYHRISDHPEYSINKELFKKQINFLSKNFEIIKLSDIVNINNSKKKKLLITLDDGTEDNYINAYGIIKDFNIPIHIFLISRLIDHEGYLNWNQIMEMKKSRLVIFGNHTKNHLSLKNLGYEEIKSQVFEANIELQEKLGEIRYFSYPYGEFDNKAIKILREAELKYGLTIEPGINDLDTDPYRLKRIAIDDLSVHTKFKLKYSNLYFKIRAIKWRKSHLIMDS
jgi:peptidoglycan/xylan/chitin deacetylase (PgdA/CDA1 family)